MKTLYIAANYRDFLRKSFPGKGEQRGRRRDLAKTLGCQTSFISLVLTDRAHFNEDMAFQAAKFLHLNTAETDFFLLLYHFERASTHLLQSYYQAKIRENLNNRLQVKTRVSRSPTIPVEIQSQYYSNWTYAAIHTAVMCPQIRTVEAISKKLNLSQNLVENHLEFLEKWQFIKRVGVDFELGLARLHLDANSPFIIQHHRNWHLEAMRAIGENREGDLNYSGALSMSKVDAIKIKDLLLNTIGDIEKQILPSEDEETVGLTLSYFRY